MQRRAASADLAGEDAQDRLADEDVRDEAERWVGETLFALVDVARRMRVDPELALRAAADRFRAGLEPE
jgi:XTP/dITP diphosphohydrolase/tetrapyrrole methylase family protein/MazG family protein/ATP diphosphatase